MVTVAEAEKIILAETRDSGIEEIPLETAPGRALANDLHADRDLPPCNRATMDGIAISFADYENGNRAFTIVATMAAGAIPEEIQNKNECVEIMTGAALPDSSDTVVRYEDLLVENQMATVITNNIVKGQNIHRKGKDKKKNDVVVYGGQWVTPAIISMAASVGRETIPVKRLPKVVIISTGGELVAIGTQPSPYQVRRSNTYMLQAALQPYGIKPALLHIPDDLDKTIHELKACLQEYDVILLSGGVSMGKFDFVPRALAQLGVNPLFHKVQQRPGKPFWFGARSGGALVFAFPGNPVSTFLCFHRYFIPWLRNHLNISKSAQYAILGEDVTFTLPMQYFMQVQLDGNEKGELIATPREGNGSGDFANLIESHAFMELPMGRNIFRKGEVYRVWLFT